MAWTGKYPATGGWRNLIPNKEEFEMRDHNIKVMCGSGSGFVAERVHNVPAVARREEMNIALDQIQEQAEKLLALLKDRQLGLSTWHEFVDNRITEIYHTWLINRD